MGRWPQLILVDLVSSRYPHPGNKEDPNEDLMDGFLRFMKEIAEKPDFYKDVDRLLHLQRADKNCIITRAKSAKAARLATGVPVGRPTTGPRQFSAVG